MNTQFIKDNVVVGVYTNKEKYLTRFVKNFNTLYPDVELIYNVYDANINSNMEILRRDFAKTNKRYWLFLDDDILFCDKNTIGVALESLIENECALTTTYQITDLKLAQKINPSNLQFRNILWSAGYFMLVDSEKIGTVEFDRGLPTSYGSLADIEYCMKIHSIGHKIGISPTYIYHEDTGFSGKIGRFDIEKADMREVNKSVHQFFKHLDKSLFYNQREMKIVFNQDGSIHKDQTIGHHYLKHKYPNLYQKFFNDKNPNHLKEVVKKQPILAQATMPSYIDN